MCRDYPCNEYTFRCSYGGCVHREVVCDGVKDCADATDEDPNLCAAINCEDDRCTQRKCRLVDRWLPLVMTCKDRFLFIYQHLFIISYLRRDDEFTCENNGQCLPTAKICDGTRHCADASDENAEMCKAREYVLSECDSVDQLFFFISK